MITFLNKVVSSFFLSSILLAIVSIYNPGYTEENQDRLRLEQARYLYDIEGNASKAIELLTSLSSRADDSSIRAEALLTVGKIRDINGATDSALVFYKAALEATGLGMEQRAWLYERLIQIEPQAISALQSMESAPGKLVALFPFRGTKGLEYVIATQEREGDGTINLGIQNASGEYINLKKRIPGNAELLDANEKYALINFREEKHIELWDLHGLNTWSISSEVEVLGAHFLSPTEAEYYVHIPNKLLRFKQKRLLKSIALNGNQCQIIYDKKSLGDAIANCDQGHLYKISFKTERITALPKLNEQALEIVYHDRYLLLKYSNRVELRSSNDFHQVLWSLPSKIQDKAYLAEDAVYILGPSGIISRVELRSGKLSWQKDLQCQYLLPFEDRIFILTHSQTCAAINFKGELIWSYEYGWDDDVVLVPFKNLLVVHYSQGKRIKINQEILSITSRWPEYQFTALKKKAENGDWKNALHSVDSILELEPGNGLAWYFKYECLSNLNRPNKEQVASLLNAARSLHTPIWSRDPILLQLAKSIGAKWVWKRGYGQKFFPLLVPTENYAFYLENDNQTLVLLDNRKGELIDSYHFPEELDSRLQLSRHDTLFLSSATRLYFVTPASPPGKNLPVPLKGPLCQAISVKEGIVFSDWQGHLNWVDIETQKNKWELKLGNEGLLLDYRSGSNQIDVISLAGGYYSINTLDGNIKQGTDLPGGTITEIAGSSDYLFAAYTDGRLICINRQNATVLWARGFSEQIFSLSTGRNDVLLIGTASKKLITLESSSGRILSQQSVPLALFNRPSATPNGYWVGTTDPALEFRNYEHKILRKYVLPDLPGNPILTPDAIYVSTLGNFILSFPP